MSRPGAPRAGAPVWLLAALLAALLQGCAATPPQPGWVVQPLLRLDDSPGQSAASYYALGRYHQQRGETALADAAFARSLALDPRQLDARNAQALLLAQQGRRDDARAAFEQLVKDFPDQAQPHNNLGYLQYLGGQYGAALSELTLAQSLDPGNRRVRANLAALQTAIGGPRETAQPPAQAAPGPHARLEVRQIADNEFRLQPNGADSAPQPPRGGAETPALGGDIALINGNGQPGMGQAVKELLARRGLFAGRVLNQRHFTQERTVIEYLADHAGEAGLVRDALAGHAVLVEKQALPGDAGIRLVLGRDLPASTRHAGKAELLMADRTKKSTSR